MAVPLVKAQIALDVWIAADRAVASGQSYSMNGRSLTLANVKEIREQIQYWERRVHALQSGGAAQGYSVASFGDE